MCAKKVWKPAEIRTLDLGHTIMPINKMQEKWYSEKYESTPGFERSTSDSEKVMATFWSFIEESLAFEVERSRLCTTNNAEYGLSQNSGRRSR